MRTCSVEGCDKRHYSRGLCGMHYMRQRRGGCMIGGSSRASGDELASFVRRALSFGGDDCLYWPFTRNSCGYPMATIDGRKQYVHRYVCRSVHGDATADRREAAHSCGNKACVNPRHLRWATPVENAADKIEHGTTNRGERHGNAKLTEGQVVQIRSLSGVMSRRGIARLFGVNPRTVRNIIHYRRWRHVA